VSSLLVVYLFFRKRVPRTYSMEFIEGLNAEGRPITSSLLGVSIATLAATDVGYVLTSLRRVPVSMVICSSALFLLAVYAASLRMKPATAGRRKGMRDLAREVNWDIILFMVSIYLVVQGLRHTGAVDLLACLLVKSLSLPSILSVLVPSLIVTVGASFMNNWPMTMLGLLSIRRAANAASLDAAALTSLIFSNIIGNNLGPHFFPLGSLAILMWLETMRRRGVTIRLRDYLRVGSVVSMLEVAVASLILWLELAFLGLRLDIHPTSPP
jgi:arsenical pump membrane protein